MVLNSNQVYVKSCAHVTKVVQECGESEALSILSFATEQFKEEYSPSTATLFK